ncbi:MAG: hypothetical protein M8840_05305 [marine benthic group bacterium]|nr:hypothetical protein [Gemmatimonadota bacterium]
MRIRIVRGGGPAPVVASEPGAGAKDSPAGHSDPIRHAGGGDRASLAAAEIGGKARLHEGHGGADRRPRFAIRRRRGLGRAAAVKLSHTDPADRFLVATAQLFGLRLVTADERLIELRSVPTLPNR